MSSLIPLPLEISLQTYDGCDRSCPGCTVDKYTKHELRFKPLLDSDQLLRIRNAVREYLPILRAESKKIGYSIEGLAWTFEFGNHSELSFEDLSEMNRILDVSPNEEASSEKSQIVGRLFHCNPYGDWELFLRLQQEMSDGYLLIIVYDPFVDDGVSFAKRLKKFGKHANFNFLPEITITRRLIEHFTPQEIYKAAIAPLEGVLEAVRFAHFVPSATRNFNSSQSVSLDKEVEWLQEVAQILVKNKSLALGPFIRHSEMLNDEGKKVYNQKFSLPPSVNKQLEMFRLNSMRSIYIDRNLNAHVNVNNLGDFPLSQNYKHKPLGNISRESLASLYFNNETFDEISLNSVASMLKHPKCFGCSHYMTCLQNNVSFYRQFQNDNGKHCYGYLPVIETLQNDVGNRLKSKYAC